MSCAFADKVKKTKNKIIPRNVKLETIIRFLLINVISIFKRFLLLYHKYITKWGKSSTRFVFSTPLFKQRFYVKYAYCNIQLLPELVYGIQVQNEGNRIEFLLAYF